LYFVFVFTIISIPERVYGGQQKFFTKNLNLYHKFPRVSKFR